MRHKNEKLPSKEESEIETKKRLDILKEIKPELEKFCEVAIVGGSVGHGKNFSVRKESDIDLIILIKRENINNILEQGLFQITPQIEEAIGLFKEKEVDNINIIKIVNDIPLNFVFWEIEAHFKGERFEMPWPKIYNIWDQETPKLKSLDFTGTEKIYIPRYSKKVKFGLIHEFPFYFIDNGNFTPRTPLLNLIQNPDILFNKDPRLITNINKIWENLTKRLIEESKGEIDLNKKNILFSMNGYWNMSEESKEKIQNRINQEIKKLQSKTLNP